MDTSAIKDHMEIISADGAHVGTVDHIDGARIKLAKKDPGSGGVHHYIAASLVAEVEGDTVRLSVSSENVGGFMETE